MGSVSDVMVEAALCGFFGGNVIADYPESRPYWEPRMRAAIEAALAADRSE